MTTFFKIIFLSFCMLISTLSFAQAGAKSKDEPEAAKKTKETKLTEVILAVGDTVAADEYLKRAVAWVKVENTKYVKTGVATTGSKIECNVSFITKPKDLNPEVDYTGKITMKVSIECKDNRYKYTVSDIKHISKSGNTTAGSIDNIVPECGSMTIGDNMWKKLKGEAMKDANLVVTDLKLGMEKVSAQAETEEW